jgi:hypothetical protein
MLKHYSHIRMEAKRTALEAIVKKPSAEESPTRKSDTTMGPHKSPHSRVFWRVIEELARGLSR